MALSDSQISINLTDTLQILSQKKVTTILEVVYEGIAGFIWIDKGALVHAKVKDLIGEKALYVCLKWEEAFISETPYRAPARKTITKSLEHILLDAARLEDETRALDQSSGFDESLNGSVEIGKNLWWVGHRRAGSPLQINVYLKKFEGGSARRPIWLLIDPGSQAYFPDISRRVSEIVDISEIQLFSANHQDPDVCSNALYVTEINPRIICVTTETTSRLLVHYGIKNFWFIESKKWRLKLITGHKLAFFPTPFCHFAGAFGIFDPETNVVFTGDLFGQTSLHTPTAPLYASEENWQDLVTFHSIYMPNNHALRYSVKKLRETCGTPDLIAAQHGGIIKGELVEDWMKRVSELQVGIDLLDKKPDPNISSAYQSAATEILISASKIIPDFSINRMVNENSQLAAFMQVNDRGRVVFSDNPARAVSELQKHLLFGQDKGAAAAIKAAFVRALRNRQLPMARTESFDRRKDSVFQEAEEEILEG